MKIKRYFLLMVSFSILFLSGCEKNSSEPEEEITVKQDFLTSEEINLGTEANATLNSCLDLTDFSTYSVNNATTTNQAKVDLITIYGETTFLGFLSPSHTDFDTKSWTTRNQTKMRFLLSYSYENWEALSSAQQIQDTYSNAITTEIGKLKFDSNNAFIAVKTTTNKYAVMYVKEFVSGINGSMKVKIKVQK